MISPELLQEIKPIQDWLGGTKSILTSRGGVPQVPINTLPDLNSKIWGLHNGLTVLGARSSMGKSAFAIQIARDVSDSNIPCLFLSLEMDVPSIIERMFCQQMSVDNFDMLCGKINNDEEIQKKWETFEKWVHRVPLMITDGLGKSFQEVTTMVELLDPKPKVVIIDYIQGIKQSEKERAELNEYIRSFRTLMLKNKMVGILA